MKKLIALLIGAVVVSTSALAADDATVQMAPAQNDQALQLADNSSMASSHSASMPAKAKKKKHCTCHHAKKKKHHSKKAANSNNSTDSNK